MQKWVEPSLPPAHCVSNLFNLPWRDARNTNRAYLLSIAPSERIIHSTFIIAEHQAVVPGPVCRGFHFSDYHCSANLRRLGGTKYAFSNFLSEILVYFFLGISLLFSYSPKDHGIKSDLATLRGRAVRVQGILFGNMIRREGGIHWETHSFGSHVPFSAQFLYHKNSKCTR